MKSETVNIRIGFVEAFKFGVGFGAGIFVWTLIFIILTMLFLGSIFARLF